MTEVFQQSAWPFTLPGSGRDAVSAALRPIDDSLFREYDIRGRVDFRSAEAVRPLDEFVANRLGRAFGTFLRTHSVTDVVVGYDARIYSEALASAVSLGLLSTGANVTMLGLTTTPAVYFAQHHLGGVAGVSVTASHNPNGWAGFKLAHKPSVTLGPAEIAEVARIAQGRTFATGSGTYSERSVTEDYVDHLATLVPAVVPLRVICDGGNSIAGPIAEMALRKAGHDVVAINGDLDWSFPNHEPDPETLEAREQIQQALKGDRADCGISFDGDGDRLGVTSERGEAVWTDAVLALLARDALSRHPGAPIVFDVKCSRAVPEVIKNAGGRPVMWMTGHSHVKAKMREIGAPFAGERSGHFFDAGDYFGFDDAIYAALRFLQVVGRSGKSVTELVSTLPSYHATPTMQADCPDSEKYRVVEEFAGYSSTLGAREIVRINGVRAEFEDGWILVRASSNLPALVIVIEADSDDRLRALYRLTRLGLAEHPEVSEAWMNDPWDTSAAH